MTSSLSRNSSPHISIAKQSRNRLIRNALIILVFFHLVSGLLGLATLRSFFASYWKLGLFNVGAQALSLHLNFLILNSLFFFCAYGYLRKSPWAWYLTFPQILLSIVLVHPSAFVFQYLIVFFQQGPINILQSNENNGLPEISYLMVSISILVIGLEVIKLIFFLLPSTKKYFLDQTSLLEKKNCQKLFLVSFLFISILLAFSFYKTMNSFFTL